MKNNCCGYPYWIPKILPLVYNDALSYLENVYALIEWCQNLCEQINNVNSELIKRIELAEKNANNYTDTQLAEYKKDLENWKLEQENWINQEISDLNLALENFQKEFEKAQTEFEQKVNTAISDMKEYTVEQIAQIKDELTAYQLELSNTVNELGAQVTKLWTAFNQYRVQVNAYIDFKCEELKGFVEAHTSIRNGNNILVWNPAMSNTTTLKQALVDIYNSFDVGRITAEEYASIGLTAQEYADYNLTAHDYAYLARFVFFEQLYFRPLYQEIEEIRKYVLDMESELRNMFTVISPLTGKKESIKSILYELADYHLNTLTAQQYADKDLTAEGYESVGWTAQAYAKSSAGVFGNVIGSNITAITLSDTNVDIVNNVMQSIDNFPRGQPIFLTVTGSDGLACGFGTVIPGQQGTFMMSNQNDIIRMYYNNGVWTTARI